jgi:hypothetical protein
MAGQMSISSSHRQKSLQVFLKRDRYADPPVDENQTKLKDACFYDRGIGIEFRLVTLGQAQCWMVSSMDRHGKALLSGRLSLPSFTIDVEILIVGIQA